MLEKERREGGGEGESRFFPGSMAPYLIVFNLHRDVMIAVCKCDINQ